MNKKIVALAVAAAFSTPALADSGNIAWYGKVYLNAESVKNDKNVAPAKDSALRVISNTSRLGIKGSEDIGNGMSGIFQYEVQVDTAGADTANGTGFGSATRNSGVGLEGNFGKVIVGKWDTPFKTAHNKVELFDNASSFTALNLIGHAGGAGTTVKAAGVDATSVTFPAETIAGTTNYNTRQSGVIEYWTPKFGAIQGALSYSPDAAPTITKTKSRLSISGTFEQDAISASAAYESRPDATNAGKTDSGLRLVGKYTMGDIWVGATLERIAVEATTSYTQSNVELVGQYKVGANKFAATYAKAGNTNVASTGANQLTLRYGHDYSARTEVFAAFTSLSNDSLGAYALTNTFGAAANQAGSKQTVIGAGVIHTF
jgi:predicted porin